MRISAEIGDPGRAAYETARRDKKIVVVYLDAHRIEDVITADEETGICIVVVRGTDGKIVRGFGDQVLTETKTGRVRVVLAEQLAA